MTKRNGQQDNNVGGDKSDIVAQIPMACADEDAAVEFFESVRFGDSPFCPREGCGSLNVYQMKNRQGERNERYLWRCRDCGRQFTVRIGTVMEDSPIPLRHWAYAFWAACSSKKGVSALQIKRQTGLSYKSALFLMHRIRFAMSNSGPEPMSSTVEVDETYVGGKPRKRAKGQKKRRPGRTADFKDRKTQVVAMVSRDGPMKAHVRTDVTAGNLKSVVFDNVDPSARLMTDEYVGYKGLDEDYASHETVNHSQREYTRGDVTTNTVEAFFALLKRGVYGTFHSVSRKHLHRYVSEFEFRWNNRSVEDGERTRRAIRGGEGKRLTYRPITAL